jgi:hypothetical protein
MLRFKFVQQKFRLKKSATEFLLVLPWNGWQCNIHLKRGISYLLSYDEKFADLQYADGNTKGTCRIAIWGPAHQEIYGLVIAEWAQEFADLRFADFKQSLHDHLCNLNWSKHIHVKYSGKICAYSATRYFYHPVSSNAAEISAGWTHCRQSGSLTSEGCSIELESTLSTSFYIRHRTAEKG